MTKSPWAVERETPPVEDAPGAPDFGRVPGWKLVAEVRQLSPAEVAAARRIVSPDRQFARLIPAVESLVASARKAGFSEAHIPLALIWMGASMGSGQTEGDILEDFKAYLEVVTAAAQAGRHARDQLLELQKQGITLETKNGRIFGRVDPESPLFGGKPDGDAKGA